MAALLCIYLCQVDNVMLANGSAELQRALCFTKYSKNNQLLNTSFKAQDSFPGNST